MTDQVIAAIIAASATVVAASISIMVKRHRRSRGHEDALPVGGEYGLRITSPTTGSIVSGNVLVTGTFGSEPPFESLFLVNASPDIPNFWPAVGRPIEVSSTQKTWRGSTWINSDSRIILVSVGEAGRALFDYYERAGPKCEWLPIRRLTPDVRKHDEVFVRHGSR